MNAYGAQTDPHQSPQTPSPMNGGPRSDGKPKKTPQKVVITSEKTHLITIAALEFIGLGMLIALNYVFRFDPQSRDAGSLFRVNNVTLALSNILPAWPYYDYSLSLSENNVQNEFGISFTMEEYAFFVPVFLFPLLLFVLVELINLFAMKKQQKTVNSIGIAFLQIIRRLMRFYYTFLMFGSISGMVTLFIKLLVPVARPHFLSVCLNDDGQSTNIDYGVFSITVGNLCSNSNLSEIFEALRSFPSYHATIAIYSTTFLCLYLFYTLRLKGVYSLSSLLSLPIVVMGLIGALHRWATFHNTFFDIAWGAVIGIVCAYVAVYGHLNRFKERIWLTSKLTSNAQDKTATMEGQTNQGFDPPSPFTKTEMVLSQPPVRQSNFEENKSFAGYSYYGSSSPPPPPLPPSSRNSQNVQGPSGRPTQAINTNLGPDDDPRRRNQPNYGPQADYNRPRQRFSIPGPPRAPSAPRPNSAHPMNSGYPRSKYEGTSYF